MEGYFNNILYLPPLLMTRWQTFFGTLGKRRWPKDCEWKIPSYASGVGSVGILVAGAVTYKCKESRDVEVTSWPLWSVFKVEHSYHTTIKPSSSARIPTHFYLISTQWLQKSSISPIPSPLMSSRSSWTTTRYTSLRSISEPRATLLTVFDAQYMKWKGWKAGGERFPGCNDESGIHYASDL